MPSKHITQVEARAYKAKAEKLAKYIRNLRYMWPQDWIEGKDVHYLGEHEVNDILMSAVITARKLGHAVIVSIHNNKLQLMADLVKHTEDI